MAGGTTGGGPEARRRRGPGPGYFETPTTPARPSQPRFRRCHFSPEHLAEEGRKKVMERFWDSREFIEVGHAPEQLVKEARRPAKETGPQGAMAQLRGMVDHDDVRPVLNRIYRPLILLQSKKSDFVPCELGPDARVPGPIRIV